MGSMEMIIDDRDSESFFRAKEDQVEGIRERSLGQAIAFNGASFDFLTTASKRVSILNLFLQKNEFRLMFHDSTNLSSY